jgi:hypothetical protein
MTHIKTVGAAITAVFAVTMPELYSFLVVE